MFFNNDYDIATNQMFYIVFFYIERDYNERPPERRERPNAWTTHRNWNNECNADDLLPEW